MNIFKLFWRRMTTVVTDTTKILPRRIFPELTFESNLKKVLAEQVPIQREKIKKFRKDQGSKITSFITVDMIYSGMRGVNALVCDTSVLDPEKGIHFRGLTIPECQKCLPKFENCNEPLPEGLFWLLLTGEVPTLEQAQSLSKDWANRAHLPPHVATMLNNFPDTLHPMSQFNCAITALNMDSKFQLAYSQGIPKSHYWEYIYEDCMDLIAKLPVVAATIYQNTYKEHKKIPTIDPNKDWSHNLACMLGYEDLQFVELLRLFLTIHSDHEGGNVCAHTTHLVGSALADPYLAFAAGINGLAGPLNGMAIQDVLIFLKKIEKDLGESPSDDKLKEYIVSSINDGQIIPGFGHPILRKTDPRYICQREFAKKYLPHDPMVKLVAQLYKMVPPILMETGKVKNPWPNVDAHSGVLLQHYGMTEINYYTVLFGVSRSLGVLSWLIWTRALGLPIERPKSFSTDGLMLIKPIITDMPKHI